MADETTPRMAAEVDAIRTRVGAAYLNPALRSPDFIEHTLLDAQYLLGALDATRAKLEAVEAVLRELVADNGPLHQDRDYLYWDCPYCYASSEASDKTATLDGERIQYWIEGVTHTPDCPVTRARALLANDTAADSP